MLHANKRVLSKRRLDEYKDGYLFVLPVMAILVIFTIVPSIQLFIMSINSYRFVNGVFTGKFIGGVNYEWLLEDDVFIKSLITSFKLPLTITPIQTILALFVAVLLTRKGVRGIQTFRTIYFIPVVMSFVVVAMFWKNMLNTNFGVINGLLGILGISRIGFLTDPSIALWSVVLVSIWKSWGWYMVIFISGINEVPLALYESASLDGANDWQQFRYITLPGIRNAMMFVIIISTMNTIKLFTPIKVLTDGGPNNATRVIVHYIWSTAFQNNDFGYAAAMAVVLFGIMLIISLLQYKVLDNRG